MIVKDIVIDGKTIRFAASASITRIYREKFNRDIITDMKLLSSDVEENGSKDGSNIPFSSLEIFENVAYVMAYKANKTIEDNVIDWLDQFDTFSIYEVLPKLVELWKLNEKTFSIPKKK